MVVVLGCAGLCVGMFGQARPNFLFAIADDQSYPHASAYGAPGIQTPTFDRLARHGVLFHNAFAAAPQCSPSRSAILTGRNIWELKEAGTHGSLFPREFPVFTRRLEEAGYHVGYTGKAWAPGNWEAGGWKRNPVGTEYNWHELADWPTPEISDNDYARNFRGFLEDRDADQPFFFWYGAKEPHREYAHGSGARSGKNVDAAKVPPFLPDHAIVRNDFLDYALEIEWFDRHLGRMLEILEEAGELENTVVVVTSDNGMPFPYAKANLQEFGTHVPLVIAGGAFFSGNRKTDALVSLIDLAPTFLELAGVRPMKGMTGQSLVSLLTGDDWQRDYVLTGRERHTHARPDNVGYPARALRTKEFLYVWNIKPERWPAGNPPPGGTDESMILAANPKDFKPIGLGYADIDDSPTKAFMIEERLDFPDLFFLGFGRRPEEQLYAIGKDPWCLHDLSRNPRYAPVLEAMRARLEKLLRDQEDPRVIGGGEVFESYPRFGRMRAFPGFKKRGAYNPEFHPEE